METKTPTKVPTAKTNPIQPPEFLILSESFAIAFYPPGMRLTTTKLDQDFYNPSLQPSRLSVSFFSEDPLVI
jgi:hypothetical protein